MVEAYLGEIRIFGFNFAPLHWSDCNGQILQITQNQALFSLIGATYGGNGQTTFGLPDFRGRMPMHTGGGPGLTQRNRGNSLGAESVMLEKEHLPLHNHTIYCSTNPADITDPQEAAIATEPNVALFSDQSNAQMKAATGGGGAQSHENMSPFLTLRFCICIAGTYPSRN